MKTTLTDCARIYLSKKPDSTRKEVHEFCQSLGVANNAKDELKNVSGILSKLKARGEADFQKNRANIVGF